MNDTRFVESIKCRVCRRSNLLHKLELNGGDEHGLYRSEVVRVKRLIILQLYSFALQVLYFLRVVLLLQVAHVS